MSIAVMMIVKEILKYPDAQQQFTKSKINITNYKFQNTFQAIHGKYYEKWLNKI